MQIPELCLGTVQFGLDYGISNQADVLVMKSREYFKLLKF